MLELDDYTISQLLYEDALTRVYRGIDRQRHLRVILKTPRGATPDARSVARMRRDYEFLAELSCAGVARPITVLEHGRSVVLVQEDAGGELLSAMGPTPCPLEVFFPLALSLVAVLERIHRRRVIHLDIKPQSIFYERSCSRVNLGDFGLASRLSREHPQVGRPEQIESALPYLAPEQTGLMNRTVDFRADYYALGVIFYQLLTGRLPFAARDALEWVHCHLARPPRSPLDWVPELPRSLAALVLKLLSKVAEDRYQGAPGLRADLLICQMQWQSGQDAPLELGRADISEQLQLPQRLYGRAGEVQQLLATFERVAHGGRTEWVLVSGYSGVGKSALVAELHKPIIAQHGRYISGKFDQYKRGIPYGAVAEALRGLVQQLLAEGPERILQWRALIQAALGEAGQVVVDLIPLLERIVGVQPPLAPVPPDQARHRALNTLQKFVGVFATAEHPLVLLLDDLQWVDSTSLSLLTQLAGSVEARYLLLIGAFRDNEVGASHPLTLALESLRRQNNAVQTISLAPLGLGDVCHILADALHCPESQAAPLAGLVYAKTRGNPFFCFQFLNALHQDELLTFDPEQRLWVWDLARIQSRDLTDNVVDLMVGELRRLPEATRQALTLASFLGSRFERHTLAKVLEKSPDACEADLWPARQTGLLIGREGRYRFLHDRVQEAAYVLTPAGNRPATHLRIGRLLLDSTPASELEEHLFAIVAHLNNGAAGVSEPAEQRHYAELNLRAALKAQAAAAYPAACEYCASGISLLPPQAWTAHHELTRELHLTQAECEYLSGRLTRADEILAVLLEEVRDPVERARAYLVEIKLQVTRGDNPGACEIAQASLMELGVRLPLRPSKQEVNTAYGEIQALMQGQPLEALLERPQITERAMAMAIRVITSTSTAAIFTDQSLWALHDTQMVILSLRYGNSDDAVMAYLFYGFMLGAYLNRYHEGYRYTEIAFQLMERRGATQHRGSLVYHQALAALWVHPLSDGIAAMRSSLPSLLEVGNMIIACLALRFIATYHLLRGDPLERVEAEAQRCRAFAQEKHYPVVIALNESTRQLVRKLRGVPPDTLAPETAPAEAVARSAVAGSTDRIPFVIVAEHLSAVTWHCIMAEYVAGYRELRHAEPLLWAIPGLLPNYDYFYYGSICSAAAGATLGAEERESAARLLAENLEQLRTWAESNPGTFSRSYLLVAAELARLERRHVDAMRCYEQAIEAAREGRYVQDEALASERAACCHMELGLAASAEAHLRNAYDGYSRWGAAAKLRQMEATYPRIREYWAAGGAGGNTNSLVQLDMLAITRAAQAISGQIVRDKLLQTLLSIAVEQAGAQSAALLLVESGKLRLAATARVGVEEIVVLMRKDTELDPPLPRSILCYVQHSREAVLLSDDLGKRTFASDPYLQQTPPASMLCMPILRQDALVGVLYLEHADIPQVFTQARLAVLEQLAVQAAISLENAELYGQLEEHSRTLEERVAARTEELRTTIEDLEAFSTTLSHDLQAPLRHISSFTDRLDKHCGTALDATAQHYLEIMRKSARRMDQMVAKLLEFARTSRARMEPTAVDLGELTRDVLESLQMDLQGRRVAWRIQELPRVTGDRALLRSVLTNLIGNAIKYTRPRDPAVIEIGAAASATVPGALSTAYVRDNGVGFDPNFAHKLFGEFQRLHSATEFEGSGIGLVSVRRIIERHGGKVWAEGAVNNGATFYFSLPAAVES